MAQIWQPFSASNIFMQAVYSFLSIKLFKQDTINLRRHTYLYCLLCFIPSDWKIGSQEKFSKYISDVYSLYVNSVFASCFLDIKCEKSKMTEMIYIHV